MKVFRQGDVSIIAIEGLPGKVKHVKGEPILARGEVTGHAHRMIEGKVRLYQLAGLLYLKVLSEFARLYHEEHEDVVLPRGDYQIRQQREFEWRPTPEMRRVRYVAD